MNCVTRPVVVVFLIDIGFIVSTASDTGSDCSSVHDLSASSAGQVAFIDYGSTPGGQGDGSLDREKAEGEVTLRDLSVTSFLDEVIRSNYAIHY